MGWSSGGYVFDPVAETLREMDGIPDHDKTLICVALIKALEGNDWDTQDESLEHFQHAKFVVDAFAEAGVYTQGHRSLRRFLQDNFPLDHDTAKELAFRILPVLREVVDETVNPLQGREAADG